MRRALAEAGVECFAHPGLHAVDDLDVLRTQAGKPYTVFSPFHRAWLQAPRREVSGRPRSFGSLPPGVRRGSLPSLASLGLEQEVEEPLPGGESAARERLSRFLGDGVREYADNHDALGSDKTSRLSPYVHFGCLSPRELESRLPRGDGPDAFRRQLCWRDFYHQVLLHFPRNAHEEFQERYRAELSWNEDDEAFRAWCDGRTGYPLVDAGMRQLRREGWMHNRARHMERFDPRGEYVRRYVPELRAVPDDYLREPWTMPEEVQRRAGCVIGEDYPEPVVDRSEARVEAFARYGG